MPAGVTWPKYIAFFTSAMVSMFAGAQTVHVYYKPLSNIDKYIELELSKQQINQNKNLTTHNGN